MYLAVSVIRSGYHSAEARMSGKSGSCLYTTSAVGASMPPAWWDAPEAGAGSCTVT